jgi:hypothetical protein
MHRRNSSPISMRYIYWRRCRVSAARVFGIASLLFAPWYASAQVESGVPRDSASVLVTHTGVLERARESIAQLTEPLRRENPDVPEELWVNFAHRVTDPQALIPIYASIYRRHLSTEDIDALVGFYETPLGQRLEQGLAQIASATNATIGPWTQSIALSLLTTAPESSGSAAPTAAHGALTSSEAASIRQLMRVSGALAQAETISRTMLQQLSLAHPGEPLMQRARTLLWSGEALATLWIPEYARYFSANDIRDFTAFYTSPLGSRWAAAIPAINTDALAAATALGNEAAKRAIREVLGPLPQWRLMHPLKKKESAETGESH